MERNGGHGLRAPPSPKAAHTTRSHTHRLGSSTQETYSLTSSLALRLCGAGRPCTMLVCRLISLRPVDRLVGGSWCNRVLRWCVLPRLLFALLTFLLGLCCEPQSGHDLLPQSEGFRRQFMAHTASSTSTARGCCGRSTARARASSDCGYCTASDSGAGSRLHERRAMPLPWGRRHRLGCGAHRRVSRVGRCLGHDCAWDATRQSGRDRDRGKGRGRGTRTRGKGRCSGSQGLPRHKPDTWRKIARRSVGNL